MYDNASNIINDIAYSIINDKAFNIVNNYNKDLIIYSSNNLSISIPLAFI